MRLFRTGSSDDRDPLAGKPASWGIHRYLQGSANLFEENRLLKFAVGGLFGITAILATLIYTSSQNARTVVVPFGSGGDLYVTGNAPSAAYLRTMTRNIVSLSGTYSAYSADRQFQELLSIVHPSSYNSIRDSLNAILAAVPARRRHRLLHRGLCRLLRHWKVVRPVSRSLALPDHARRPVRFGGARAAGGDLGRAHQPRSRRPRARVTREIADLLATVARRLEKRGHTAERTSGFLMRLLFTMFAEDSGLIPEKSFTNLLKNQRAAPQHLEHQLTALWAAMDAGDFSPALGVPLRKFNGYLFKDRTAIPLDAEELDVLIQAAEHTWTEVEPAIFGTLLERALNPKERAKLGAHYTPRAYVERLVGPTIIEPLRADWAGVRVAATELIDQGTVDDARRTVEAFHGKLASTKVLDPACGTGNFLYVAMARMKELEGEVLDLLADLGDKQYLNDLSGGTITPENFLGIEINPRAAAIAQLVLWIGYLQWHFRVNGADRPPPEPILRDIRTIENRDALIEWDERVLECDASGAPVTRWDGETMKPHAVTGKPVPDEAARVEVYRYVKPRAAVWPKADFIVGNPPFIGSKRMRTVLGDEYVDAVQTAIPAVPDATDLVLRWWHLAADLVGKNAVKAAGLVGSNSIQQAYNRRIIERHLSSGNVSLAYVIANHPWTDEKDGAAVRISMSVLVPGKATGRLINDVSENDISLPEPIRSLIHADFRAGADVGSVTPLKSNDNLCCVGMKTIGSGSTVSKEQAERLIAADGHAAASYIHPYINGRDVTDHSREVFVIDLFGLKEAQVRAKLPAIYQYLLNLVKPERDQNRNDISVETGGYLDIHESSLEGSREGCLDIWSRWRQQSIVSSLSWELR